MEIEGKFKSLKHRDKYKHCVDILEFCMNIPKRASDMDIKCSLSDYKSVHILLRLGLLEKVPNCHYKNKRTRWLYLTTKAGEEVIRCYYAFVGALSGGI